MKINVILFLLSLTFYCVIGLLFAFNTQIVFHPYYSHDLFLGYDNLLHQSSTFRHPLLSVFPLIGNYLQTVFSPKTISIIIVIACSLLLSIQNVFAFIFAKKHLHLDQNRAMIAVLFFSCFAPNVINSFNFDSFILSSIFLSIYWHVYFSNPSNVVQKLILGTLITGTTITNGAKVWISYLFQKRSKLYNLFTIIGCIFLIVLFYIFSGKIDTLKIINYHAFNYQDALKNIWMKFLGGVFVLPNIDVVKTHYYDKNLFINFTDTYRDFKSILLVTFCILLMLVSYLKNYKSNIVKILSVTFLVDVLINVVLGYGLKESYIYASHYQFLFFVLSALLIKDFCNNRYFKLFTFLGIIALLSYNLLQLYDLYSLAKFYYPQY